jgi:hypothetical protein
MTMVMTTTMATTNAKSGNMYLDLTTPPTRCRIPALRSPTKHLTSGGGGNNSHHSHTPKSPDSPHPPSSSSNPRTPRRMATRSPNPTKVKIATPEVRASTLPRKKKEGNLSVKNNVMSTSAHAGLKSPAASAASVKEKSGGTEVVEDYSTRCKTLPLPGIITMPCLFLFCFVLFFNSLHFPMHGKCYRLKLCREKNLSSSRCKTLPLPGIITTPLPV